ncbi:inner membrane protein YbjM [Trabulsiella odontotermitis]|uniref:Membrane protein n=1 Tax=Trabulsiella odontotermitis TaxID=379893 RepID=A0A0L0GTF8_9ENTR|nr:inner membrane protein YbjM [Trabulsiella odontotermitis]KNC92119.1 membrane protein [Trabulsiella odontotermitis]KNC95026.1 membrane protein [Trabulsiella odontotermitis]
MKSEHGWVGVACCFLLFIVVCFSVSLHMKGVFPASGNSELGLLFFLIPGALASIISVRGRVMRPVLGAILAMPLCLLLMRFFLATQRSFWQELAWLFSAVFWCALGALCGLFICSLLGHKRSDR